jgi:hypothetical protein
MDVAHESAFFYEFVYGMEEIEQPFDEWLPQFLVFFEKVIKGEETPSDNLKVAMHIAYTRWLSTTPTPEHQDESPQCLGEAPAQESS